MGGSLRRESSVIFFCLREAEPVQEQLVIRRYRAT
jgi:hypothetical protein